MINQTDINRIKQAMAGTFATKDEFRSEIQKIDARFEGVNEQIKKINQTITVMQADIITIKATIAVMQTDIAYIKSTLNAVINSIDAFMKRSIIHEQEMAAMGFRVNQHDLWIRKQDPSFGSAA